jgi:hypothetical protein
MLQNISYTEKSSTIRINKVCQCRIILYTQNQRSAAVGIMWKGSASCAGDSQREHLRSFSMYAVGPIGARAIFVQRWLTHLKVCLDTVIECSMKLNTDCFEICFKTSWTLQDPYVQQLYEVNLDSSWAHAQQHRRPPFVGAMTGSATFHSNLFQFDFGNVNCLKFRSMEKDRRCEVQDLWASLFWGRGT